MHRLDKGHIIASSASSTQDFDILIKFSCIKLFFEISVVFKVVDMSS